MIVSGRQLSQYFVEHAAQARILQKTHLLGRDSHVAGRGWFPGENLVVRRSVRQTVGLWSMIGRKAAAIETFDNALEKERIRIGPISDPISNRRRPLAPSDWLSRIQGRIRAASAAGTGGSPTVNEDHGALNSHPGGSDIDEAASRFESHLQSTLNHDLHSRFQINFHSRVNGMFLADLLLLTLPDREGLPIDLFIPVSYHSKLSFLPIDSFFSPFTTMS